jgi:hypothetical protein
MFCCLFCALIHQLEIIGINCVFISISLCHGGVLGDWHCAWPCEYTKLCRNGSANIAIAILCLKCMNINSIYCFPGIESSCSHYLNCFCSFGAVVNKGTYFPGCGSVGTDLIT